MTALAESWLAFGEAQAKVRRQEVEQESTTFVQQRYGRDAEVWSIGNEARMTTEYHNGIVYAWMVKVAPTPEEYALVVMLHGPSGWAGVELERRPVGG